MQTAITALKILWWALVVIFLLLIVTNSIGGAAAWVYTGVTIAVYVAQVVLERKLKRLQHTA